MPVYKWIGNRILTKIQNMLLRTHLSEMHSGYRSYHTRVLKKIPFRYNSLGFDFDADIIIQVFAAGFQITEVPIPTYYGDEICHVNGLQYAWQCLKSFTKYRLMQFDIFYDPKFDLKAGTQTVYSVKEAKTSLHHFMRGLSLKPGMKVLDVGGGDGRAASLEHAHKGINVTCIDQQISPIDSSIKYFSVDLDRSWEDQFPAETYDAVFALDVLEHVKVPEVGVAKISKRLKSGGRLYASTGNIAFFMIRFMLFFGQFNYGRRGILDLTHKRLFTVQSFKRLFKNSGFHVESIIGFPPPFRDLFSGKSKLVNGLDRVLGLLAKKYPAFFAFGILVICRKLESAEDLMRETFKQRKICSNHKNALELGSP